MAVISSFTFNASEQLKTHTHDYGHIIIVLDNTFRIAFHGNEYELTPDTICFVPPGVEHSYSSTGKALTLNIPASMVKEADRAFLTVHCVLKIEEKLKALVELIKQEIAETDGDNDSLRYLFYYLYDKFVDHYQLLSVQYMKKNYANNISIQTLAALENYNVSYYSDWFKKKTGMSPTEYLKSIRIEKAKEILATTRYRVYDVALQVGYNDASSFSRAFKEVTGKTPNKYRTESFDEKREEKLS